MSNKKSLKNSDDDDAGNVPALSSDHKCKSDVVATDTSTSTKSHHLPNTITRQKSLLTLINDYLDSRRLTLPDFWIMLLHELVREYKLCDPSVSCSESCRHRKMQAAKKTDAAGGFPTIITTKGLAGGVTLDYIRKLRNCVFGPADDDPVEYFPGNFIDALGGITNLATTSSFLDDEYFSLWCKDAATNTDRRGMVAAGSSSEIVNTNVRMIYGFLKSPKNKSTNTEPLADDPGFQKWGKDVDTSVTPEPALVTTSTSVDASTIATVVADRPSTAKLPKVTAKLPKVVEMQHAKQLQKVELHAVNKEPNILDRMNQMILQPSTSKNTQVVCKETDPAIGRWKRMLFHGNQVGIFDSIPEEEVLCKEEFCSRRITHKQVNLEPQIEIFSNIDRQTARKAVLEAKNIEILKSAKDSTIPAEELLEQARKKEEQEQWEENKKMFDNLLKSLEEKDFKERSDIEKIKIRQEFDETFTRAQVFQNYRLLSMKIKNPVPQEEMKKEEKQTPVIPPIKPSYIKGQHMKSGGSWADKEELDLIFAIIDGKDLYYIYSKILKRKYSTRDILMQLDILMRDCPVRSVMKNLPNRITEKFKKRIMGDAHLQDMIASARNGNAPSEQKLEKTNL